MPPPHQGMVMLQPPVQEHAAGYSHGQDHAGYSHAHPGLPPKAGDKAGDWTCPKCQNVNFAFRYKCNRCGHQLKAGREIWEI